MIKDIFVLLGSPGSGKSTQAILLADKLNLFHLSWGKILRAKEGESVTRKKIGKFGENSFRNRFKSLSISKIIGEKISSVLENKESCFEGIVLDGFPRNKFEAGLLIKMAKKYDLKLKAVVNINCSLDSIKKRVKKRSLCQLCGRTYDQVISPKIPGICDIDGNRLIKERMSNQVIEEEFNQFIEENKEAYIFLKNYADFFFSVSGDDDETVTFSNIIYKLKNESRENFQIYKKQSSANLPTIYGDFMISVYLSQVDYTTHIALVKGDVYNKKGVLTRVHSSCMTGDLFGSLKCDCGQQLHRAMQKINKKGIGIVIYLLQEGRGINIVNKINAYFLQSKGLDTVEANEKLGFPSEMRNYEVVRDILQDLGVKSIRLLTNNPDKINKLVDLGIVVEGVDKIECKPNKENERYLSSKKEKMKHALSYV